MPEGVDFYLGRPLPNRAAPQYLGSGTMGYDIGVLPELLALAEADTPLTAEAFEQWVCRSVSVDPEWPWPWESSTKTPWAVCFASRALYVYRFGTLHVIAHLSRWAGDLAEFDRAPFPSMKGPT